MEIIKIINPENLPIGDDSFFEKQESVRGIVFDKNRSKIATQYSTNHNYHKLPGGGIENGENFVEALNRECLEELGYAIKIEKELGITIEYRNNEKQNIKRLSYCYVAKIVNDEQELKLDAAEKRAAFIVQWMTLDEALKVWEKEIENASQDGSNKYILPRDLSIIKYFLEKSV